MKTEVQSTDLFFHSTPKVSRDVEIHHTDLSINFTSSRNIKVQSTALLVNNQTKIKTEVQSTDLFFHSTPKVSTTCLSAKQGRRCRNELPRMLYIARDLKYIDQPTFDELYSTSITISSKLSKLISYLKQP